MIPAEAAHATVSTLGELGIVQFIDLNPHKSGFQKTFSTEVITYTSNQIIII